MPSLPNAKAARAPADRENRRARVRFAIRFAVMAGLPLLVYSLPFAPGSLPDSLIARYLRGYAALAAWVIARFDPSVQISGANILGHSSLSIVMGCDAAEAQILFAAAVFALQTAPLMLRFAGWLGGSIVLTTLNVARIASLYFVGTQRKAAFEFLHLELWPAILVAVAAAIFVLWAKWASTATRDVGHATT